MGGLLYAFYQRRFITSFHLSVDKASGIKKEPNAYGDEQGHPEYLLDLVLAVIAVSVKTQRLIETLPKLTIKSHTDAVCLSSDLSRVF